MSGQTFCLKWEGFQTNVTSLLEELRVGDELVDITLCCEGRRISAHRVLLSACSPYFRDVLKTINCQHMVFYMKDTSYSDLHALIEFIYKGSVNVLQSQLPSFIKTAESLQIRGLSGDSDKNDSSAAAAGTLDQTSCHQPRHTSSSAVHTSSATNTCVPPSATQPGGFSSSADGSSLPLQSSSSPQCRSPMSSLLEPCIDIHCTTSSAPSGAAVIGGGSSDRAPISPQAPAKRRRYNAEVEVDNTRSGGASLSPPLSRAGLRGERGADKGSDSVSGSGVECGSGSTRIGNVRSVSPVVSASNTVSSACDNVAMASSGSGCGGTGSIDTPTDLARTECTGAAPDSSDNSPTTVSLTAPATTSTVSASDREIVKVEKIDVCDNDTLDERDMGGVGEVNDPHLENTLGQVAQYEADHSILGTGNADMMPDYLHHHQHQQDYMTGGEYQGGVAPIDYVPGSSHVVNILEDGTSQERFVCRLCGRSYTRQSSVKRHMEQHRGLTVCPRCQHVSSCVTSLRQHLKRVHRLDGDEIDQLVPRDCQRF